MGFKIVKLAVFFKCLLALTSEAETCNLHLKICRTSDDCVENCATPVENIRSSFPNYLWGVDATVETTGLYIAYSEEKFRGNSKLLPNWSGRYSEILNSQMMSFRSVGYVNLKVKGTITFYELENYVGLAMGSYFASANLDKPYVFRSYIITGDSNWLIRFGRLDASGSSSARFDLCATPGYFSSYELSKFPVVSFAMGCTPF